MPEVVSAATAAAATTPVDATTVNAAAVYMKTAATAAPASSATEVCLETAATAAAADPPTGSTTEIAAPPAADHGDAVTIGSFGCFAFLQQSKSSEGGKKVKAAGAMWASAGKLLDSFKLLPVTKVVAEEEVASVSFGDKCSKLKRNVGKKMRGLFKKGH